MDQIHQKTKIQSCGIKFGVEVHLQRSSNQKKSFEISRRLMGRRLSAPGCREVDPPLAAFGTFPVVFPALVVLPVHLARGGGAAFWPNAPSRCPSVPREGGSTTYLKHLVGT